MNECENISKDELLNELMSLNFAITDISLYLDTHPQDTEAIRLHCDYSQKQSIAYEKYTRLYGPLTINDVNNNCSYWQWVNNPWPWERRIY